jgi:hypothetical protein
MNQKLLFYWSGFFYFLSPSSQQVGYHFYSGYPFSQFALLPYLFLIPAMLSCSV